MPDSSLSDPPHLLILSLSCTGTEAAALSTLLAGLPAGSWRSTGDPAAAETALAAEPGLRLLLLCPRPDHWVARALAEGAAPSQAVGDWRAARQPLMALLRARRRQVVLVFEQSLAALLPACAAALGLPLQPDPGAAPSRAAAPAGDPVLGMIAREALRRDPAARALAEELVASALNPDSASNGASNGASPEETPDTVFAAYAALLQGMDAARSRSAADAARIGELESAVLQEGERLAAAEAARADLAAEAALLHEQVRMDAALQAETQGRLGAEQGRSKAAEAQEEMIRQLRAQIHQTGQGLESCHAQIDSLGAERDGLLDQLHRMQQAQADLEGYYDRARAFSEQVEALTAELQKTQTLLEERERHRTWLQDEIGRIHRSRSYRLTAPLRRIRKIVG
ncbi:hypothetical protein [Szabonella alba]|uniref:Uncharacterized protein n=1 Tax=Szabonella alba TaxID=2804194 RepID=A0A8K0VHK6_9RHOB|nr:hypothetical protein [Szabonella alba]MBL4919330.1 hypothetical protein [Szabonella alba]